MNRKNVTFIDDLFDADSMASNIQQPSLSPSQPDYIIKGNNERDEFSNQIKSKNIRSNDRNYSYALNGGFEQPTPSTQLENYQRSFFPFELDSFQQPRYNLQNSNQTYERQYERQYERPRESQYERPYEIQQEISCMTIANHIKDCPICSKFYNCDNSMYIVCIALLIIVCIILLKRIIEK
jgi:hypothetical protein